MNVKTIIKVMNFHSLLRVDRAHRQADQYLMLEKEVTRMIDLIQHNRNFILDQQIQKPRAGAPRLRIYFGSDLGFCGAANASVNAVLDKEGKDNTVVTVGRKLHQSDTVTLRLTREELEKRYDEIDALLTDAIRRRRYSGIDLCYDHYYNMSHIETVEKTIFPLPEIKDSGESYDEDFSVEGSDVNELMEELIITYLNFQVRSAAVNAFASENILRQNSTNEAMKRVEEMEEAALIKERKIRNDASARKVIDSYNKTRYRSN